MEKRQTNDQSWKISCACHYQVSRGKVHQESTWRKCPELEHDSWDVGVPANGAADQRIAFSIKLNSPLTIFYLRTEERHFTWINICFVHQYSIHPVVFWGSIVSCSRTGTIPNRSSILLFLSTSTATILDQVAITSYLDFICCSITKLLMF